MQNVVFQLNFMKCVVSSQHLNTKQTIFAELVCSNSLRGDALTNAVGLLKEEMRRLGSVILESAEATRVPLEEHLRWTVMVSPNGDRKSGQPPLD